jgi:hypothetical protein
MGVYDILISGSAGAVYQIDIDSGEGKLRVSETGAYISSAAGEAYISSNSTASVRYSDLELSLHTSGAIFTDSRGTPRGIEYSSDISATFNNESLITKRYVDTNILWSLSGVNIVPKLSTYQLRFANSNQIIWGSAGNSYIYGTDANWYLYVGTTKRIHVDSNAIRINHHIRGETTDTYDIGTTTYWFRNAYLQRLYIDSTDIYLSRITTNSMGIYGHYFYIGRQNTSPTNNTTYGLYLGEWSAAADYASRMAIIGRNDFAGSSIGYLSFHQTYNNSESQDRIAEIAGVTTSNGVNYGELQLKTTRAGTLNTDYITRLDHESRLFVKARSAYPVNIERYTSYSSGSWGMFRLFHETTASSIANGFGINVDFSIKDSGGVENVITRVKATRDGADDRGKFTVQTGYGSLSDRFSVAANGYVLVGSGTAAYPLHVIGDVYTPNDMHANDFILISDRRLKKHINIILPEDGLSMALAMNPITHEWKLSSMDKGVHIGFIADEVKKIHPSLVKATGDNGKYEGVLYNKLTVINNSAIHALYNKIKLLEDRIKELEENGR